VAVVRRMKTFGKVNIGTLRHFVLPNLGIISKELVEPANIGVDFAVVKSSNQFLIVSADPITGTRKNIGWYAIHISANDVATSGNRPRFVVNVILLSEKDKKTSIREITEDIDRACRDLGVTVVGGHTEVTKGIEETIVVVTAFTFSEKYITSKNARLDDVILMTKTAGIEGTSILAADYSSKLSRLGVINLKKATKMIENISIVEEAERAYSTGYVHAMHDPTEGGVLGGVYEMSLASNLGFLVDRKKVPLNNETAKICGALNIDPLKLISSGVLLMAVDPKGKENVEKELRDNGYTVTEIGRFIEKDRVLMSNGRKMMVDHDIVDELWKIKARKS